MSENKTERLCVRHALLRDGVKAYHWARHPLALHGVIICKKDGTTVDIAVGDNADDPVFCISDLLIHLSSDQMSKPAGKAVEQRSST